MPCIDNVCGTGGWTGPKPGDPNNNSLLTATPAFGGVDVSWTYPDLNPAAVAHTILYRGLTADFASAIVHHIVSGGFFYDKIDVSQQFYYWISIISVNGTPGAIIGPATALARPLIEDLITQLTGQIDNGVLAQSLKTKLDEISTLNANLLTEIFDRTTGNTSLAAALAAVDAGVAEALAFVATEVSTRITNEAALVESINLVAVTAGSDLAAVSTSMTAQINSVDGLVDAMYTAKVTVNGLVGGFGLHSDGLAVDAGFDVDTFWVGRTAANKRKPFIVVGSETFIDQAVINELTFSKLKAADGSFIVSGGRIQANHLTVNNASITGDISSSNWVYGVSGWYLERSGNFYANNGEFRGNLLAANGTFSGTLTAANIVNTSHIVPNAATTMVVGSGVSDVTIGITTYGYPVMILGAGLGSATSSGDGQYTIFTRLYCDGVELGTAKVDGANSNTHLPITWAHTPAAGYHTYRILLIAATTIAVKIGVIEAKR